MSNAHYNDLRGPIPNAAYLLASQTDEFLTSVEVRADGPPASAKRVVRAVLAAVDSRLPVMEMTTLDARVHGLTAPERSVALLATVFGAVALLLACLGLYGTMSYNVARRTPELGVRIALGAGRGAVLWLVLGEALVIVAFGLMAGLPLALIAAEQMTRFVRSRPDLTSYALAAGVLVVVAAIAAWMPARRAASVDPVVALRAD